MVTILLELLSEAHIIVEFVFRIAKVREWAYTRVEYCAWKLLESWGKGVGLYPKVGWYPRQYGNCQLYTVVTSQYYDFNLLYLYIFIY